MSVVRIEYLPKSSHFAELEVYVDKRITLGALKKELESYVGTTGDYFKVSPNWAWKTWRLSQNSLYFHVAEEHISLIYTTVAHVHVPLCVR